MAYDLQLQLALQLDKDSLKTLRKQIESSLTGINVGGLDTKSFTQANVQVDNLKKNFQKGEKQAKSFFDRVQGKGVGFAAYTLASQAILKLTGAVTQATRESIKFESELIKISQVTGRVVKGIQSESKALFDISKRYNVTISKIAELTRTLTQTGISFREAAKGAEVLAKTSLLATFESLTSTTEGLIATMQTFNLTVEQSGKVLEKINAVSKAFAVESSDIVEAIRRTGGAFSSAGGQVEELIALFTSVRSTSRESAETIATGFRTIFGRLQRPKTIEYFKQLGIQLETAEGQFIGPLKAIESISVGLEKLGIRAGSIKFAEVVEQIGGIRQLSRVVPLLEEYSKTQKALDEQNKSSGSTAKDLAKAQQGLGYQIGVLKQEFTELISDIVNSASFKTIAQTFIGITKTVLALTNALKPLLPLITAIATVKIGRGLTKLISGGFNLKEMKAALGFASGGMVPGTGDRDTVPAMLTPGEFVIRKSAVKAFGADRLAEINKYAKGGKINRYADGGIVDGIQYFEDGGTVLSKEEKKRRREQYKAEQLGTSLSRGERTGGVFAGIEAKYNKLLEEERQLIRDAFSEKIKNAIAERKSTAKIYKERNRQLADATKANRLGMNVAKKEAQTTIDKKVLEDASKGLVILGNEAKDAAKEVKDLAKENKRAGVSIAELIFYQQQAGNALRNFAGIQINEQALQAGSVKAGWLDILSQSSDIFAKNFDNFNNTLKQSAVNMRAYNGKYSSIVKGLGNGILKTTGFLDKIGPKIIGLAKGIGIVGKVIAAFELAGSLIESIFAKDYGKAKEGFIEAGDAAQAGAMAAKEYNQRFFRGIPVLGGFISAAAEATGLINMELDARGELVVATAELRANTVRLSQDFDRASDSLSNALIRGNKLETQNALRRQSEIISSLKNESNTINEQTMSLQEQGPDLFAKVLTGIGVGAAGGATAGAVASFIPTAGIATFPAAGIGAVIGGISGGVTAFTDAISGHTNDIVSAYEASAEAYKTAGEMMKKRIETLGSEFSALITNTILAGGSLEDAGFRIKETFGDQAFQDIFGDMDLNSANLEVAIKSMGVEIDRAAMSMQGMSSNIRELQNAVDNAWEPAFYNFYLGTKNEARERLAAAERAREVAEAEQDLQKQRQQVLIQAQVAAKNAEILAYNRKLENDAMRESIRLMKVRIAVFDELDMGLLGLEEALESINAIAEGRSTSQQILNRRGSSMQSTTLRMDPEQILRTSMGDPNSPFMQMVDALSRIDGKLAGQLVQGKKDLDMLDQLSDRLGAGGDLSNEISNIVMEAQDAARESGTGGGGPGRDVGQKIAERLLQELPAMISPGMKAAINNLGQELAEGLDAGATIEEIKDKLTESQRELIEKVQQANEKMLEMEQQLFQRREELSAMRIELINREYALTQQVYDAEMDYLNKRLALNEKVDDVLEELPVGPGRAAAIGARAAQRRGDRIAGIENAREAAGLPADTRGREGSFFEDVEGYRGAARVAMDREGGPTEGETRALSQTFAELEQEGQLLLHTLQDQIDAEQQYLDGLIEMAKAQQEYTQTLYDAQGDLVRELVTGTEDEVGDMLQGLNAALVASQQGSFAGIPEDLKKQVFSVFDAFGDVVIPGLGVTGRDAQREITKNELMRNYGLDQVTAEQLASKAVKDRVPIDERMKEMIELQEKKIMELLEREKMLNDYMARLQNINNQLFAVKVDKFAKAVDDFAEVIDSMWKKLLADQQDRENPGLVPNDRPQANDQSSQMPIPVVITNPEAFDGGKQRHSAIPGDWEGGLEDTRTPEQRQADQAAADARAARTRQQVENTGNGGVRNPVQTGGWSDWWNDTLNWAAAPVNWMLGNNSRTGYGFFAKGGIVYAANGGAMDMSNIGFKPKGTDTVPAMLTPGEFVVRKKAVDKLGVDTLNQINNGTLYANDGALVPEMDYRAELEQRIKNEEREMQQRTGSLGILGGAFDWFRKVTTGDGGNVGDRMARSKISAYKAALKSGDAEHIKMLATGQGAFGGSAKNYGDVSDMQEELLATQNELAKDLYMTVPTALAGTAMAGAPGAISPYLTTPLTTSGKFGLGLAGTANLALPWAATKQTVSSTLSGSEFNTKAVGQDVLADVAGAGVLDVVPGSDIIASAASKMASPLKKQMSNAVINNVTNISGDIITASGRGVNSVIKAKTEEEIGARFNKGGYVKPRYLARGGFLDWIMGSSKAAAPSMGLSGGVDLNIPRVFEFSRDFAKRLSQDFGIEEKLLSKVLTPANVIGGDYGSQILDDLSAMSSTKLGRQTRTAAAVHKRGILIGRGGSIKADVLQHELGHVSQSNLLKMGNVKGANVLEGKDAAMQGLIEKFLNDKKGYEALKGNYLSGKSGGVMYTADDIGKLSNEMFTELLRTYGSDSYRKNKGAQNLLGEFFKQSGLQKQPVQKPSMFGRAKGAASGLLDRGKQALGNIKMPKMPSMPKLPSMSMPQLPSSLGGMASDFMSGFNRARQGVNQAVQNPMSYKIGRSLGMGMQSIRNTPQLFNMGYGGGSAPTGSNMLERAATKAGDIASRARSSDFMQGVFGRPGTGKLESSARGMSKAGVRGQGVFKPRSSSFKAGRSLRQGANNVINAGKNAAGRVGGALNKGASNVRTVFNAARGKGFAGMGGKMGEAARRTATSSLGGKVGYAGGKLTTGAIQAGKMGLSGAKMLGKAALRMAGPAIEGYMAYNAPTSQSADMNNPNADALSNRDPLVNMAMGAIGGGSTTMGDVGARSSIGSMLGIEQGGMADTQIGNFSQLAQGTLAWQGMGVPAPVGAMLTTGAMLGQETIGLGVDLENRNKAKQRVTRAESRLSSANKARNSKLGLFNLDDQQRIKDIARLEEDARRLEMTKVGEDGKLTTQVRNPNAQFSPSSPLTNQQVYDERLRQAKEKRAELEKSMEKERGSQLGGAVSAAPEGYKQVQDARIEKALAKERQIQAEQTKAENELKTAQDSLSQQSYNDQYNKDRDLLRSPTSLSLGPEASEIAPPPPSFNEIINQEMDKQAANPSGASDPFPVLPDESIATKPAPDAIPDAGGTDNQPVDKTAIPSFNNTGAAGRIQEQFNNQLAQIRQRRGANFGNGMAYSVTPNQQQMGAPMMPPRSSSMLMAGQFGQQNNGMNNGMSGMPMSMQLQGSQEITIRLPDIQALINQNITSMIYETIGSFFRNLAGSVRTANNFEEVANSMENGLTETQTKPVGGK